VTNSPALVAALKTQVLRLQDDLRTRLTELPEVQTVWRAEFDRVVEAERTASPWVSWRDDRVTQAAVSWVLTTVFVRFCEDNALVSPVWIAGPRSRRQEALDAQLDFFRRHPDDTDREWLRQAVDHLGRTPATQDLVDAHAGLWTVSPSGTAASDLLTFWRQRDEDGDLLYDFTDPTLDTRFLGDLYQDLSEHAKKTYALLQTPVFVEEFILDQTMEPALAERQLDGFRMIDPTCGSGHFLLGAFTRLLTRWDRQAPAMDVQARVQLALDAIHGVDLNPFAVAIARFRLTIAALQACGLDSLEKAPDFDYHLAAGDSLLIGTPQSTLPFEGADYELTLSNLTYSIEDLEQLKEILQPGRYDVVVGNPPYITVKDKKLNEAYRKLYSACKGQYALTVPFMQRFFQLAKRDGAGERAGWVGQITSNSFMKREFGSKLIKDFLVRQDLRLVADTSGAYIPGHGTPTVIIVGRHNGPSGVPVRAVLGVRGEPGRPPEPAKGLVWTAITRYVNAPGHHDSWISVVDLSLAALSQHPWSLTGGGASQLRFALDAFECKLLKKIHGRIGFASFPGSDEGFFSTGSELSRSVKNSALIRSVVAGDVVRDWETRIGDDAFVPYDSSFDLVPLDELSSWYRRQWPLRTTLGGVTGFGGETKAESGASWWGWYRWVAERYRTPLTITFAFVATHNHFVLDRGGKVFNRSAPVIKLPEGATEDDHLGLLGVLNSSTACFWLKQNSHNKGEGGGARVDAGYAARGEGFRESYEFTGTTLQDYPLPSTLPTDRARSLDDLSQRLSNFAPTQVVQRDTPTSNGLTDARKVFGQTRGLTIAQQEELDWEVYGLYGLLGGDLISAGDDLPALALGERAFEIALARQVAQEEEDTTWFSHPLQLSTPITEIPTHWPQAYRELVQRRLGLIESDPNIRLLERPEYKRRWATEPWEKQQERALRGWLLDRLEDRSYWFVSGRPTPQSVSQLADVVARDEDLVSVLALWEGRPDASVVRSLTRLLADEAVPFLAAYRLKEPGMRKREAWEETWALQRREDAGEDVGVIPVPPKYTNADFRRQSVWQARGKLDVPKERFILYPDAGRATDATLLLGWAGWDHAQQFLALATVIAEREAEGWADERLIPLVAGLAELVGWVQQWHAEVDPTFGVSMAVFCQQELVERSRQVNQSPAELAAWRPTVTRGRKART